MKKSLYHCETANRWGREELVRSIKLRKKILRKIEKTLNYRRESK